MSSSDPALHALNDPCLSQSHSPFLRLRQTTIVTTLHIQDKFVDRRTGHVVKTYVSEREREREGGREGERERKRKRERGREGGKRVRE